VGKRPPTSHSPFPTPHSPFPIFLSHIFLSGRSRSSQNDDHIRPARLNSKKNKIPRHESDGIRHIVSGSYLDLFDVVAPKSDPTRLAHYRVCKQATSEDSIACLRAVPRQRTNVFDGLAITIINS
jgi:hypothetical protein